MGRMDLREALAQFGPTKDDVAVALALGGDMGCRRSSCYCPVANFLERQTGYPVRAYTTSVYLFTGVSTETAQTPGAVGEFLVAFDRGEYPELDLEADWVPPGSGGA